MTDAKFTRNAPQGSGLTSSIVDRDFRNASTFRPTELIAARVLLQATGFGGSKNKDGSKAHVVYEIVRLEPAVTQHDADEITWEIAHSYEARTGRGGQDTLPLVSSPGEQRESVLDAIKGYASEHNIPMAELDARWVNLFGGRGYSSETVQSGGLLQLMEFGRYIGAIDDPKVGKADDADEDEDAA